MFESDDSVCSVSGSPTLRHEGAWPLPKTSAPSRKCKVPGFQGQAKTVFTLTPRNLEDLLNQDP